MPQSTNLNKMYGSASGGGAGTMISVLVVWFLDQYMHTTIPPEVVASLTGLLTLGVGMLGTFMAPHASNPTS